MPKELMTKHYEAEQREVRRTVEEHLAATRNRSSRPPSGEYLPEIPRDPRLPQLDAGQSLLSSLIPQSVVAESAPPRKKLRILVATGSAVAVALIAGVLLVQRNTNPGGQPAAAGLSVEPRKPAEPPEQPSRPLSAESVWVTLSAAPNDAEIRLDGRRVSNPYRAVHGRDAVSHHITVSLDGYNTLEREVAFTSDLELQMALDAATQNGARKQKGQSAAARQAAVNPPAVKSALLAPPLPPTQPAAATKAAAPRPGDDLRALDARPSKARDIDETDPYKR